jgi:hypothetical protein
MKDGGAHAAALCAVASCAAMTVSNLETLEIVAPFGEGLRSDSFQRLKVVGWMPARLQASDMGSPTPRARASSRAMISCWSMERNVLA